MAYVIIGYICLALLNVSLTQMDRKDKMLHFKIHHNKGYDYHGVMVLCMLAIKR